LPLEKLKVDSDFTIKIKGKKIKISYCLKKNEKNEYLMSVK